MTKSIVLIGPYGAGKSTIGKLLAEALNQRNYSLDEENPWKYFQEVGLTLENSTSLGDFDSPAWQPYHRHAVKRFLAEHNSEDCVMDLGAGHSLYDGDLLEDMKQTLAGYTVILLLPSPQIDESLHDLKQRNNLHPSKRNTSHTIWNTYALTHPANQWLANHTVYTKGLNARETCDKILGMLKKGE